MQVTFRPAAGRDVMAARRWYDKQATGLGAAFAAAIAEAVERLQMFPESGPVVAGKHRRLLLPGFPYAVYYQINSPTISVVACLHAHRSPAVARSRT